MNQSGQAQGSAQTGAASSGPKWGQVIRNPALISSLLAVVTVTVFAPVGTCGYLHYDDADYITSNPQVLAGLTISGVRWAFTTGHAGNWHPLTWLSHMLDVQLFGPGPAGVHLVNLAFHTVNTVLLFWVLRRMTGALWRSALVAVLFALHPLHVESVAWVAERKDVLSGLFFMITLWAYTAYVQIKSVDVGRRRLRYMVALGSFALGLMSKPMLVTIPFLLLLLDYWPLGRMTRGTLSSLVKEKIPFLVISAVSSVVTFLVQREARIPMVVCTMSERIGNALVAYARYLGKTLWPVNLANPYPHPGQWPLLDVVLAGLLLAAVCSVVWWWGRRFPFVFTGWFWFLGMLIPVIGLVQVGSQAMADRYTYLPLIGLFLALVWGAARVLAELKLPRLAGGVIVAVTLVVCGVRARDQVHYWRDSESLFGHAIAVTKSNWLAYYNLGWSADEAGRVDEALGYYRRAVEIKPTYPEAQNNIGFTLARRGQPAEAVPYFEAALRAKPGFADAGDNLGVALLQLGRKEEAIAQFEQVLQHNPNHLGALNNLGNALSAKGAWEQAVQYYETSVRLKPVQPTIQYNLGNALARLKKIDPAIDHYRRAVEQKPDYVEAHYALGMALWQNGDLEHAVAEVTEAVNCKPEDALLRLNLAKLLVAGQRFDEAISVYREAIRLGPENPDAHNALGAALAMRGDLNGAIEEFQAALRVRPDNASAHFNLGKALAAQHKLSEATNHLSEALRLRPDFTAARQELEAIGNRP